ncbi:MAG: hypothetical protein KC613_20195 [Myxococcales bacterium]|nr:hypothetical protein [Myxococcales bacterium]
MGRRDLRRRIDVPANEQARRPVRSSRARRAARHGRLLGMGLTPPTDDPDALVWKGALGPGQATVRRLGETWAVEVSATELPGELRIGSEAAVGGLRRVFMGKDVQTGDMIFDDAVRIDGPEALVRAACTVGTRRLLTRWVPDHELQLQAQRLTLTFASHSEQRLVARLRTLRSLLQSLCRAQGNLAVRLLRNAARDPVAQVRTLSLLTLLEGPLQTLDARRRRRAILVGAGHPQASLRKAAAPLLVGLLNTAEVAFEALPERALWTLLAFGDPARQVEAAHRLGAVGGADSVPPLAEHADAFFGTGALKTAARAAIAQILERTGGLRSGGLSLAEDQAGELSLLGQGLDDDDDLVEDA